MIYFTHPFPENIVYVSTAKSTPHLRCQNLFPSHLFYNTYYPKYFTKQIVRKIKITKNPNLADLESGIEETTGIKVFIRNKKNNTGQVTFEYKDLDQLNRLIMVIKANY